MDWSFTWAFDGNVDTSDHTISIQLWIDDLRVDTETGIAVNSSLPHTFSTTGAGGLGGSPEARAVVLLLTSAGIADSREIPADLITN